MKTKTIKHLSGTVVTITNKRQNCGVRINVKSTLLKEVPEYKKPKPSFVSQALKQLFTDLKPI